MALLCYVIIKYHNKDPNGTPGILFPALEDSIVLALSGALLFKCRGIKENNTRNMENGETILSTSLVMPLKLKAEKTLNYLFINHAC